MRLRARLIARPDRRTDVPGLMSAIPLYGHTVTCLQPVDAKQLSEESVAQNIRHRPAYPAECVGYISLGPLNTMSVAGSLMLAALTLIAFALPLAGYILVKERTLNLQKVWNLAVVGRRPARLYVAVVLVAFALAVVGWFFALADHRAEKRVGAAAPNLARQPTTFGRS